MPCHVSELNLHVLGARMLGDVGESFLNDAIQRGFNVRSIAALQGVLDPDRKRCASRDAIGKELQRWRQTEIIQNRGPELMGKSAQLLFHLIENRSHFLQTSLERGAEVVSHARHGKTRGYEELSSLVMDGVADRLNL